MEVVQPYEQEANALAEAEAEMRNIFANTFFSFTRPKLSAQQQAFLDILKSGILWEDGSTLALGLMANKRKELIPSEQIVGGEIDVHDPFWTEERDEGASYLDMFLEHHLVQNEIVAFGNVDEINDPNQIGGGIFRLSLDTTKGSGPVRWASYVCYPPENFGPDRNDAVQGTIDNMKANGWDVWVFESTHQDPTLRTKARRTNIFVVFPDPVDVKKAHYWIEKAVKTRVKKSYEKRTSIATVSPFRKKRDTFAPIPSFVNDIYGIKIEAEHIV